MKAFRQYAQDGVLSESLQDEKEDYNVTGVNDVLAQNADENASAVPSGTSCGA